MNRTRPNLSKSTSTDEFWCSVENSCGVTATNTVTTTLAKRMIVLTALAGRLLRRRRPLLHHRGRLGFCRQVVVFNMYIGFVIRCLAECCDSGMNECCCALVLLTRQLGLRLHDDDETNATKAALIPLPPRRRLLLLLLTFHLPYPVLHQMAHTWHGNLQEELSQE